jgi:S-formylglutathione hydrolase FrmB
MAVSEIHFTQANSIQKMTAATVIYPEQLPGPFPVLYLLHGLSDDHTAWVRRTSLERYCEGLPLIVVCPNGERSFYTDAVAKPNTSFETLIVRDLVGWVDATMRTIPRREGRVVEGLSMGGYGALKLALKHPDMFCAAVSHSGVPGGASHDQNPKDPWQKEWVPIFGRHPQGGPNDVYALAKKCPRDLLPALRIDCGKQDFLIEDNRKFHRHLTKLRIPHEYAESTGAHTWEYWDREVRNALKFFCRVLKIERAK